MKDISDYTDSMGFIYHREPNIDSGFGDSCQRTFMHWISLAALNNLKNIDENGRTVNAKWSKLNAFSEPVRHWDGRYWPGKPGIMSRDNFFPAFCALLLSRSNKINSILVKILKRGGFLWNTKKIGQQNEDWKIPDFSGLLVWLLFFRLDLFSSLYLRFTIFFHLSKDTFDDTSDDLNIQVALMTLDLLTDRPLWPTEGKTFTRRAFEKTLNYYCKNRGEAINGHPDSPGYIQAFQNYFHNEYAPPLDVAWEHATIARGWPR